jgi:hypothetical protein
MMKIYRHTTFGKAMVIVFKLAAALAVLVSTFPLIPFMVLVIRERELPGILCYVIAGTLIGWAVALTFFNFYPEVLVDEEGMQISFMFSWVRILWQDVIDCRERHLLIGATLVRARKITPVHILYGWMFANSLFPAFLISDTIDDRDDLIREINHHLAARKATNEHVA